MLHDEAFTGVAIDLRISGAQNTIGAGWDQIVDVESISGQACGDTPYGDSNDNHLFAIEGDDFLFGHAGNDTLEGGPGSDVPEGGLGDDALWGNDWFDGAPTPRAMPTPRAGSASAC